MPRYAVIDCGTNTFHLLIAQAKKEGGFKEIYRERRYIKLAEEGIQTIGEQAYQRAIQALTDYAQIIQKHKVVNTRVSGTAALRTASNGYKLVIEAEASTGLKIDIIPGDAEAQLIHKGVEQAIGLQENRWMIMDIGGGSVEFIIVDDQGVRWFESFPIGVAITYKHFHKNEPIAKEEITHLETFLAGQLANLHTALLRYPTNHLVGAAGTFDVIGSVLGTHKNTPYSTSVRLDGFQTFCTRLIHASREERHLMSDIPDDRADMIVVALILVGYIMKLAKINQLTVSDFSMKEGMLSEMMLVDEDQTSNKL